MKIVSKPRRPVDPLELKSFRNECPKCEYEEFTRLYDRRTYDLYTEPYDVPVPRTQKYLDCTCKRCEYSWYMQTADDPNRSYGLKPC